MSKPNPVPTGDHDASSTSPLPALTDEAAVKIIDFLHEVLDRFEDRYGHQIHRYYDDHSQHNLMKPDPNRSTNDPPF